MNLYVSDAWSIYNDGDEIVYNGETLIFGENAFADLYSAMTVQFMTGGTIVMASSESLNEDKTIYVCAAWKDSMTGDPCFGPDAETVLTYGTDAFSSIADALKSIFSVYSPL